MDLQLQGKNAVILGGTRGIGRSIAEVFMAEGANVALCARNAEQVAKTVAELQAGGGRATGAAVDIADGQALQTWIAVAAAELGGIDILVSNAGAMATGPDVASWELNFRVDVLGVVNAFEAAKPFLIEAGRVKGDASVVIISSNASAEADHAGAYGPIKSALIRLGKGMARQYAGQKVRTNVVSPGTVYFEGGAWAKTEKLNPERFEWAMNRNPSGRMATPEEIANSVVFLSSPLSAYTNGINMVVDGCASRRTNF